MGPSAAHGWANAAKSRWSLSRSESSRRRRRRTLTPRYTEKADDGIGSSKTESCTPSASVHCMSEQSKNAMTEMNCPSCERRSAQMERSRPRSCHNSRPLSSRSDGKLRLWHFARAGENGRWLCGDATSQGYSRRSVGVTFEVSVIRRLCHRSRWPVFFNHW